MAVALNPFKGIGLFFKGLSGGFDVEYDDDEGFDKKELEELNKISEKNINEIVQKHGTQTLKVDDEKEGTDRLGIKKPKISTRTKGRTANTETKQQQVNREEDGSRE